MLAVGLFAGSDSYSHIYTLARDHGQAIASAALLPLAGDGLIAAASSAMLVASRQGRDVPVLARVMLLAGIGATIAANVGYGLHAGITGALLSVWPVAAYVGCMELLTWMRRNTGMHPAARPASADAVERSPYRCPAARQAARTLTRSHHRLGLREVDDDAGALGRRQDPCGHHIARAGLPPQRAWGGTFSPFMRKESG